MNSPSQEYERLSRKVFLCFAAWFIIAFAATFIGCGCNTTHESSVPPPPNGERDRALGYADAVRRMKAKHGPNITIKPVTCVWVNKTRRATDPRTGKQYECGGWTLSPTAYAMWVGQPNARGSHEHESIHCILKQNGMSSEEEDVR